MKAQVGVAVSDILDRAARIYIKQEAPESYDHFVWQVHGAGTVRHYDGSDVYWKRVQATLDSFFTVEQRGRICRCLMRQAKLARLPESDSFRAVALAEARVAELMAGVMRTTAARGPRRSASDSADSGLC